MHQMAINKIEHIGIAVKNLEEAEKVFTALLGVKPYKKEIVDSEGVLTSFFTCGESKIELLVATKPNSTIARFIEKKGEGIHHIAFAVDNIDVEIERLIKEGFELIHKQAKQGADNKLIAFLHPKSSHGVLVELCQDK